LNCVAFFYSVLRYAITIVKGIPFHYLSIIIIGFRYNEKKVFHCDDDTKALINGVAHQLNGLSYIIDDSEKRTLTIELKTLDVYYTIIV
jgi:hypothetical protein